MPEPRPAPAMAARLLAAIRRIGCAIDRLLCTSGAKIEEGMVVPAPRAAGTELPPRPTDRA